MIEQGDLAIIMHGAAHTLYCDPITEGDALPLEEVLEQSGFTGKGTLVYGTPGTNKETQLICGHFAFDDDASHPLIEALPADIVVKNYGENGGRWMETTLRVISAEAGSMALGSDLIAHKMSEVIFAQVLRALVQSVERHHPLMAGLCDIQIVRTLEAIHNEPGYGWSLERLSELAGMSRTSFVNKFTACLSMTPMEYITYWRMQIARKLLVQSQRTIIDVAESVGYQSEAAFGRVFKKNFDLAPATYRRVHKFPAAQEPTTLP